MAVTEVVAVGCLVIEYAATLARQLSPFAGWRSNGKLVPVWKPFAVAVVAGVVLGSAEPLGIEAHQWVFRALFLLLLAVVVLSDARRQSPRSSPRAERS